MKVFSTASVPTWLTLFTITKAASMDMHIYPNCGGPALSCPSRSSDECCSSRTIGNLFNYDPVASIQFDGLPPTSVGLVWQGTHDCGGTPANIGFGVSFCVNSVPSIYEPQLNRLITHCKWKTLTKVCDTTPEACKDWDFQTGLKNGLDLGGMQRIGAMPINLFSRDLHDEVEKEKADCQMADKLTFANGHKFDVSLDVMNDEDYALLFEHAIADSNIEDVPEHLQKYEVEREHVLARRQLPRSGMRDSAQRLAEYYTADPK